MNKEWTTGRRNSFITSVIRRGFTRWPAKFQVLANAKQGKKVNESTGRLAEHYECNVCKGSFAGKDVQVDHILPAVPTSGWVSWDDFIDKLYCDLSNLQVICRGCHSKKTKEEGKLRKECRLAQNVTKKNL